MHRLFVAIDIPDEIRRSICRMSAENLPGARWVPEEQVHLTLRFIGEVDDAAFTAIRQALANVKGENFSLTMKGVGHFPPGRHPRVLWIGLEANETLPALQRNIEQALADASIPPDERKFSPHITIARLKETPLHKIEAFKANHGGFAAGPFPVTEFLLYSSTLSSKGAIHRREATYPLQRENRA